MALHDPADILRDVEAKRRVLARHVLSAAIDDPELPWNNRDDCQYDGEDWPCPGQDPLGTASAPRRSGPVLPVALRPSPGLRRRHLHRRTRCRTH
ncbi:DUF6221 family protein [Streptomyces sp. NPDC058394]|uniref:DUF6221 family protein n=1 Tax=unclassified Streptomyces TaxID=2593676 RepID=UPI00366310E3